MPEWASLQDDLNFQRAKQSLRQLVVSLDLSDREKAGLERDLDDLEEFSTKLENNILQIAAFGRVGTGKSSLLNALAGRSIFQTGPIHGVTQHHQIVDWQVSREPVTGDRPMRSTFSSTAIVRVSPPPIGGVQLQLIDTPGIDEVDGEERAELARQVARQAELILFVISGDMTRVEFEALAQLREANKPILLVFNKVDRFPDADRQTVYDKIRNDRVKQLLSPDEVVMAASAPRIAKPVVNRDGTLSAKLVDGPPQVEQLKLKILNILHREGRSLMALNTLLFADEINEQIVQRKLEIRGEYADRLVWNAARIKAAAVALNPVTILDTIGGAVVDVVLILKLSQLYGIPMTRAGATKLLRTIALSMGSIGAGEMLATLGLGSLKSLFGGAASVTGGLSLGAYASVAVTQAGVAGVSSYAIGKAAKYYLARGASWGPQGPKSAISQILDSIDDASIVARIKSDLKGRLELDAQAD
ncbi:GTP-binding protein [Synechococcus sp. PCC 7336]|uniref:GTP-binding protein n=1 Tax=Synechococcus sp. PCC 7336 TaxID=195250 RepID=UPI00034753B9|nr:GTP-binding protein [Synechococcus sp. PCC 7336]